MGRLVAGAAEEAVRAARKPDTFLPFWAKIGADHVLREWRRGTPYPKALRLARARLVEWMKEYPDMPGIDAQRRG